MKLQHEIVEQFAFKQAPLEQDVISVKPLDIKKFSIDFDMETGGKAREVGNYQVTDGSLTEQWDTNYTSSGWNSQKTCHLVSQF